MPRRSRVPAYLGAHGPATPEAFDQWLLRGATPKRSLRRWFAELVEEGVLAEVRVDAEPAFARATDLDTLAAAVPTDRVRLLPAFDQWVLAPGTADPHVVPPARRALVSRAAGWISPVVIRSGCVVGTWEVDDGTLAVALFPEAGALDQDALAAEVAVLERVLGRELDVSVTTV